MRAFRGRQAAGPGGDLRLPLLCQRHGEGEAGSSLHRRERQHGSMVQAPPPGDADTGPDRGAGPDPP